MEQAPRRRAFFHGVMDGDDVLATGESAICRAAAYRRFLLWLSQVATEFVAQIDIRR
jgi:hypothetical protein